MSADLLPSERVLWTGNPVRFPLLDRNAVVLVPFGVVAVAFVAFMSRLFRNGGLAQWVIPTVMACVFAWLLLSPWLLIRSTRYTVTDQRIVIETDFLRHRERSVYLSELEPPIVVERSTGVGTVRFGARMVRDLIANAQRSR